VLKRVSASGFQGVIMELWAEGEAAAGAVGLTWLCSYTCEERI